MIILPEPTPSKAAQNNWLAPGTRLLVQYGSGAVEVKIIASRGGYYALQVVGFSSWREIMTENELILRRAVVLALPPVKTAS